MGVDKKEVENIAHLARLMLDENEVEEARLHFSRILKDFDTLKQVPTQNVEPMVTPHSLAVDLREDRVAKDLSLEELMSNAPDVKDGLFRVPPVV